MRTRLVGGPRHGQILYIPDKWTADDRMLHLPPGETALALNELTDNGIPERRPDSLPYRVDGKTSMFINEGEHAD